MFLFSVQVFCAEVLACCLPLPGPSCSLSALSSADLEYRTLLALALKRWWSQSKANVIVLSGEQEIVDQIMLVPGGMQWLISGKPGSHKLHNIGAWSLPSDGTCIVVKDMECQGIIAIGSRDKDSPNRHATVFSLSLKPALNKFCDYSLVPGTIAGISQHLLFLDTTSQKDGGGLEVLDWHAKTEGTALLPCIPELFGAFLGLVHFSDRTLVTWEGCITCADAMHGLFVYEGKFGPEFEMERVVYEIETVDVGGRDKIDFDEGMGRLVFAKGSGGFDVMQLL
ncbi:uncharacterized protein F5147DRAFT_816365 [Suillus discolor]|uniref:Uncharacterized protein n=1 Tax=Suillus discolor TaxID=1912936 RepID=A0A9P7EZG4_9AGAM|nr:uncharacterized protein F5147DRAFT_816365 [Suillus discolor]KAG2097704.1 hypothetical protein F5147DRAFT_816365 [Suillus discolor]